MARPGRRPRRRPNPLPASLHSAPERGKQTPIERSIELALEPGNFIEWDEVSEFTSDLERVKARIDALVKSGEAARAVGLYELFIAGCFEKADSVHDECEFSGFVESLFESWLKAREAAGVNPAETVQALLDWIDKDNYGFCSDLDKKAVACFSRPGLAVYEMVIRGHFEAERTNAKKVIAEGKGVSYKLRNHAEVLKVIALRRGSIKDYLRVAEETGLNPADCVEIAEVFNRRKRLDDVLVWVDKGLALLGKSGRYDSSEHRLKEMKRETLKKLGRSDDALAAAWAEFQVCPSPYGISDLMKYVPKDKTAEWREKVVALALQGPLDQCLELLNMLGERERLADRVKGATDDELAAVSHFALEPAAKRLIKCEPVLAGKLYQAQGMRILIAKKSKYYRAALSNFRDAKKCFTEAGQENLWQALVTKIRAEHRQKYGFIPEFEKFVAGSRPDADKSFLDRAREKWLQRSPTEEPADE